MRVFGTLAEVSSFQNQSRLIRFSVKVLCRGAPLGADTQVRPYKSFSFPGLVQFNPDRLLAPAQAGEAGPPRALAQAGAWEPENELGSET